MRDVKKHTEWVEALLHSVEGSCEEGAAAVAFMRARKTKVGFRQVRPNVGAFWTPLGNIRMNAAYYSYDTPLNSARLFTLIIHEVRHLQQGPLLALSVFGELDAWQLDFRVFRRLTGNELPPVLLELMSLPLGWDRDVLRQAQKLMQVYAGKGYRSDLLPLYPMDKELAYIVFRKIPVIK